MAEKDKDKSVTTPDKAQAFGKSLVKWGLILLALVVGYNYYDEKNPSTGSAAAKMDSRQYATAFDFSKVKGDFYKASFVVPAGEKWVSVALPADYHVAFTWNEAGAIDKGDGKGPRPFKKDENFKLGKLGTAVDLNFPAGDTVEIRLYRHGKTQQPMAKSVDANEAPAQKTNELEPVIVSGYEQG